VSLVTPADLWLLGGIPDTDEDAPQRIARAERLLASALRRPSLESADRTEKLWLHPDPLGKVQALVYPTYTPVTLLANSPTVALRSPTIIEVLELPNWQGWALGVPTLTSLNIEVTYRGGWTAATLPEDLRLAVVDIVAELGRGSADGIPEARPGLRSVKLDGATVTYTDAPPLGTVESVVPPGVIARWRRR
jgi:hypothetical protein